jgi:quinol monooxygenase YgiN
VPEAPVTVVIIYRALPGKEEAALEALGALVSTVVAVEKECLGITVLQDASDPTRFLLYEAWTDKASYVGPHLQTPHIRAFIDGAPGLFAGPPDISFWERRGDVCRG